MKTMFAVIALVLSAAALAQTPPAFQAPSDAQVWGSDWNCTTNPAASFDEQGPVNDGSGNYYGIGYFSSFRCVLKVVSGHGGGVQYRAACATVVWDANGNVLSVTNFAQGLNRTAFVVPCTP